MTKDTAQPAQEPWRESASDYERGVIDGRQMQAQSSVDKAVNAMAQRTWVDLTDNQIEQIYYDLVKIHRGAPMPWGQINFGKVLQAAIKEKNNAN